MLALLASGLAQLPGSFSVAALGLGGSASEVSLEYITIVDKLVTSNDELAGSVEAVEIMFLQAIYYTDIGKPRKGWLTVGRAVKFAQLLGLHRYCASIDETDAAARKARTVWMYLCLSDRTLSQLLGLPGTTLDTKLTISKAHPSYNQMSFAQQHLPKLMDAMSQIIRRDQEPSSMSFPDTLKIDQDMEDLSVYRPHDAWIAAQQPNEEYDEYFERTVMCFMHYHTRVILHLPFMLKSNTDSRFQYSRKMAIESSRSLATAYINFRGNAHVGAYACKTIDFQIFIAIMAMLIDLVDADDDASQDKQSHLQEHDWYLVHEAIELLRRSGDEPGGVVGMQAAKALETITKAYHEDDGDQGSGVIVVPYFGTVTVRGKHMSKFKRKRRAEDSTTPSTQKLNTPSMTSKSSHYTSGLSTPNSALAQVSMDNYPSQQPLFPAPTKSGTGAQDTSGDQSWAQAYWEANRFDHNMDYFAREIPPLSNMQDIDFSQLGFDLDQGWNWLGFDGADMPVQ